MRDTAAAGHQDGLVAESVVGGDVLWGSCIRGPNQRPDRVKKPEDF
jgi:hypothetical protein